MGEPLYDDPLMQEVAARRRDWNYLRDIIAEDVFSQESGLYHFSIDKHDAIKPKNIDHIVVVEDGKVVLSATCELNYLVKMQRGEDPGPVREHFEMLYNNWMMQGKSEEDMARIARLAYQVAASFNMLDQAIPAERMREIAEFVNPFNHGTDSDITRYIDVGALRDGAIETLISSGNLDFTSIAALKKAKEYVAKVTMPGDLVHNYDIAEKAVESGRSFTVKEFSRTTPIRATFRHFSKQQ